VTADYQNGKTAFSDFVEILRIPLNFSVCFVPLISKFEKCVRRKDPLIIFPNEERQKKELRSGAVGSLEI
jgi:hypothetical protein